jgi:putative tryptophan/tyrosine transport system substrate-binding protein
VKRREFIAGLTGAAAWPLVAQAQQATTRRIGIIIGRRENDPAAQVLIKSLLQGLADLGWVEGRNLHIDYRWPADDVDRARRYAAELVNIGPDLILASPVTTAVLVQGLTSSIPIVFVIGVEPVGLGYVESLARPGGNLTGFSTYEPATTAKWLSLLRESAPNLSRVIVIGAANNPLSNFLRPWFEATAQALNMQLTISDVHSDAEIEDALGEFSRVPSRPLRS